MPRFPVLLCALLLAAAGLHAQLVTVTGSNVTDSTGTPINGTIFFQPTANDGTPISYRLLGRGQVTLQTVSAPISNGAFSLHIADTTQTQPQNVCYKVWATNSTRQVVFGANNKGLASGYDCVQVAASWCADGQCNFDNYQPNLPAGQSSALPTTNYDLAGAAATAQAAAKTYTDTQLAALPQSSGGGITTGQMNSAISAAISSLNLLSASQHAATDFDLAGAAATAQANAIANASSALTAAITGLSLGTAATHATADFDAAGAASTAQTNAVSAAQAATTSAISALSLGTASQKAVSFFDAAGAATSAVAGIPTATSSQAGLLSAANWSTFNAKQAALSVSNDTNVTGGVSGGTFTLGWTGTLAKTRLLATTVFTDQANSFSAGSKQSFAASATAAGMRLSGVTADPSSLAAGDQWFRTDLGQVSYSDGSAVHRVLDSSKLSGTGASVLSVNSTLANSSALCTDTAGNATTTSCTSGGGATLTPAAPYVQIGSNFYLPVDHFSLATKPVTSGLSFLPFTPQSPGFALTSGTNGDFVVGDTASTGPYYLGQAGTTSIEAVIAPTQSVAGATQFGLFLYDAGNSKLYKYNAQNSSSYPSGSASYNGSSAPGTFSNASNIYLPIQSAYHLKLTVAGTTVTFAISTDGGSVFKTLLTTTSGTLAATTLGVWFNAMTITVLSLSIQ